MTRTPTFLHISTAKLLTKIVYYSVALKTKFYTTPKQLLKYKMFTFFDIRKEKLLKTECKIYFLTYSANNLHDNIILIYYCRS